MRKLLLGLSVLAVVLVSGVGLASTRVAATDVLSVCEGQGANSAVCQERAKGNTTNPLIGSNGIVMKITRIIAVIAGVAAVIVIIISGLSMIMAGGDANQITKSRNSLIYALVGLIVIILAQAIVSFIVSKSIT